MKRWQKIILGILIVLMVLWGGAYGFYKFYFLPKYSQRLINLAEEFLKEENFNSEDLSDVVEDIDIDEITKDDLLKETIKESKSESKNTASNESKSIPKVDIETNIKESNNKNNVTIIEEQNEEINEENNKSSNTSTKNIPSGTIAGKSIEDLEKKVDPKDKADGLKIAAKIDIGYLLGLTNGGITEEEKKQAKAHLRERLTDAEYQRLKELVYKYIHLLEE